MTTLAPDLTGTWTIDPAHSQVGFAVRHAMVATVRGSFAVYDGTLVLDAADPTRSTARLQIDAASISTGQEQRDSHLKSPDFLDVAKFPALTFTSSRVVVDGEEITLHGDLEIRGVSRPVEIDVEAGGVAHDPMGNTRAGFEGTATISRKEFGMEFNAALDTGGVLVGDKVKITLDISAVRQA